MSENDEEEEESKYNLSEEGRKLKRLSSGDQTKGATAGSGGAAGLLQNIGSGSGST